MKYVAWNKIFRTYSYISNFNSLKLSQFSMIINCRIKEYIMLKHQMRCTKERTYFSFNVNELRGKRRKYSWNAKDPRMKKKDFRIKHNTINLIVKTSKSGAIPEDRGRYQCRYQCSKEYWINTQILTVQHNTE